MTREVKDSLVFFGAALAMGLLFFDEKLSLSGDNAEFVILGRALAAGKGLVYLNNPAFPPGTKYPPGFPAILAVVELGFPGNISALKATVMLVFSTSIPLIYLLMSQQTTRRIACSVAALCLISPVLLEFSHQVMSEVPFLLASLGAFWFLENRKKGVLGVLPILMTMMTAYYIRSAGVAVIISVILYLVLRKEYRVASTVLVGAVFLAIPWSVHTRSLGGNSYLQQFLSVDPYRADLEALGVWTMIERVSGNFISYFFKMIPSIILPVPFLSVQTLSGYSFPLYILAAIPSFLVLYYIIAGLWLEGWTSLRIYMWIYFSLILVWPEIWSDYRFLIPISPLLFFAVIWSTLDVLRRLGIASGGWGKITVIAAILLFCSNVIASADLYSRKGTYPQNWDAYFKAGEWIRDHTSPDAVVACRKGFLMHLVSERFTAGYAWGEPDEVLAGMENDRVDLVVLDELPYHSTPKHLVPAVNAHRSRFQIAHQIGDQDTYVLVFQEVSPAADSSHYEKIHLEARRRRIQGDLDGAALLLKEALNQSSSRLDIWIEYFNVGSEFQRKKEFAKATQIYNEVATALPDYPNVHLNLGILYYNLMQYDASISAFRMTIANGVDNWRLRSSMAKAYEGMGALELAKGELLRSLLLNKDVPQTYLALARIHNQLGNDDAASDVLMDASERFPENRLILVAIDSLGNPRR
jgi:Tfp pilus assembly protein PilF